MDEGRALIGPGGLIFPSRFDIKNKFLKITLLFTKLSYNNIFIQQFHIITLNSV